MTIDYDTIGELVGHPWKHARRYAHRGQYDPHSLDSVLAWVNSRGQRQGLPLVGMPDAEVVSDDTPTPVETPPPDDTRGHVLAGGLAYYDPMTGGFRGFDDDENR